MEHKIVEKESFTVVGLAVKISLKDPGYQKKIMDLWINFMPKVSEIKNRKGELFYGPCDMKNGIEGDECSFESFAAVEVTEADNLPDGMKSLIIPAAKYFVVTHKGKVTELGKTYGAIEGEMKNLNLVEDREKIFFELYDERFKEDSDESELDIYSPIKE